MSRKKQEEWGCHICKKNNKPDEDCEWARVATVCIFKREEDAED